MEARGAGDQDRGLDLVLPAPYSAGALDPRLQAAEDLSLDRTLDPDPSDPSGLLDLSVVSFVDPYLGVLNNVIVTLILFSS